VDFFIGFLSSTVKSYVTNSISCSFVFQNIRLDVWVFGEMFEEPVCFDGWDTLEKNSSQFFVDRLETMLRPPTTAGKP